MRLLLASQEPVDDSGQLALAEDGCQVAVRRAGAGQRVILNRLKIPASS